MFFLFGIFFKFSSKREGHAYASFSGAGSRMSFALVPKSQLGSTNHIKLCY